MNIPKAIEILDDMVNPENTIGNDNDKKAINLGIEALKFRQQEEKRTPYLIYVPLPGETKD